MRNLVTSVVYASVHVDNIVLEIPTDSKKKKLGTKEKLNFRL